MSSSPAPPDHCMHGGQSQQTMRSNRLGLLQLRVAAAARLLQVLQVALATVRAQRFWAAAATFSVSMWKKVLRTRRKKPSEKRHPAQPRKSLPKRVANNSTDMLYKYLNLIFQSGTLPFMLLSLTLCRRIQSSRAQCQTHPTRPDVRDL